jgi:hypothetical protein
MAQPTPATPAVDTGASAAEPVVGQPQPSAEPSGAPLPQQWQQWETITAVPDVTASGAAASGEAVQMVGPVTEVRPHGPCDEKTGRGYYCPPNWYVYEGVRALHHPKPRGTIIGEYGEIMHAYNGIEFVDVFVRPDGMSTRSFQMEPAGGYETTIARYLGRDSENRDHYVEFTYYGMHHWDTSYGIHEIDQPTITNGTVWPNQEQIPVGTFVTFPNLFSVMNPDLAGFNRADDLREHYTSRFDNFELNARIRPRQRHDRMVLYQNGRWQREAQDGCVCSMLLGVRGMTLDETYSLEGAGQITTVSDTGTTVATTTGNYDIRTHNDLVGLQIGGDLVYRKGFAEFGTRAKGGAFVNFADNITSLVSTGGLDDPMANHDLYDVNGRYTDVNNQYSENHLARSRDVAGVIEVGFTAGYQLRRNLFVRAAYDMMWLNGLVLAPEQVNGEVGVPADRINRNGLQFMQSLSLGMELDW